MGIAIVMIVAMFGGGIASAVASYKNRDPTRWFAIGFLFPLFGIILSIVLQANPSPFDSECPRL
jgi:hypothetical protein